MRFSLLALISVSALAQSYFSFAEGFSLREGEDRLQISSRMHTAPSLTEFSQAGILVDWLAVYPSEIRITVGEAYALSQLKVTAYGPAGTVKQHIPLTFGLEGPGDLLDFEDWRVHGDTVVGASPGAGTIWVESLAGSSTGVSIKQPISILVSERL